jgi:hypothetical protein
MRRLGWTILVLALGATPQCECRRDATIRPELIVRVVDTSGKPVAGATVMLMHQTMPYSGLRDWWPMQTAADGTLAITELTRNEAVAYFCMHGVTHHGFFVCAGKDGVGVEIVRVGDADTIELHLHDDYQDDCWNARAYRAGGDLSWTYSAKERVQARSQVERLPAEGHFPGAPP